MHLKLNHDIMRSLVIDFGEEGFRKVFQPYQEVVWRVLWNSTQKSYSTKDMWASVNKELNESSISRASIINFMQDMAEQGLFLQETETGKGGIRGLYKPKFDESELKKHIVKTVLNCLMRDFSDETSDILNKY
jgi:predicted transcriptional regulator